jgi:protein-S-isoprenylcysteine O-methyltransferase Ste14
MKKAISVSLSIIFTILILFGPGCATNPWILVQWQFYVVVLATAIMFGSQPPLTKADLLNPTDKYSMLGISVMAVLVTNFSVIEWALETDQYKVPRPINYVGFCMIWGGLALRIFSITILSRYFSNAAKIQLGHQLIDKGIYGIIRHPSYTGAIITIFGTILWLNSLLTLPFSVMLIGLAYYHRISQEESLLTLHFGEKYRSYRRKTGSLLPKFSFFLGKNLILKYSSKK